MAFKGDGHDKFGNRTNQFIDNRTPLVKSKNVQSANVKHQGNPFKRTFKQAEPEVHTNYGYEIQSDIVPEYTKQENQTASQEPPVSGRQIMREVRHSHIEHRGNRQIEVEPDSHTATLKKEDNPYIHFRYDKESTQFKDKAIDKIALKQSSTERGGGADFTSAFTDKGKIVTEVRLFKEKDRTDKGGFVDRRKHYTDRVERKLEYFSDNENIAAISNVDDKGEVFLEHRIDKILDRRQRYDEIYKEVKQERKQLEKELKAEKKRAEKVQEQFTDTSARFSDSTGKFADQISSRFRGQNRDAHGQSLFADESIKVSEGHSTTAKVSGGGNNTAEENINSYFQPDNSSASKTKEKTEKFENKETAAGEKNTETTQNRFMTKEERLEQAKSKEKSSDKAKSKEVRKAAATKSVANMLNAKKNMQNQLGDMSGQTSGDLMKDGMSGLLQTMVNGAKEVMMQLVGKAVNTVWKWLISILSPIIVPIAFFILVVVLLGAAVSGVGSALGGDAGDTYDLDVDGDGYVYVNLDETVIDDIITALYANYSDMTATQEAILRYALSKVGCAYDQAYHGNLTVDIFDCSSLAYRSYLQAGIDISNAGNYTAAGECYQMDITGLSYEGEMKPGDLIFYGNSGNGRYLGVYHVAIYVGKVNGVDKMVEARSPSWGVVYCDVRTNNVVRVARPY